MADAFQPPERAFGLVIWIIDYCRTIALVIMFYAMLSLDIDFDPSKENRHTRIDFRVWRFSLLHPCLAATQCQYYFDTVLLEATSRRHLRYFPLMRRYEIISFIIFIPFLEKKGVARFLGANQANAGCPVPPTPTKAKLAFPFVNPICLHHARMI